MGTLMNRGLGFRVLMLGCTCGTWQVHESSQAAPYVHVLCKECHGPCSNDAGAETHAGQYMLQKVLCSFLIMGLLLTCADPAEVSCKALRHVAPDVQVSNGLSLMAADDKLIVVSALQGGRKWEQWFVLQQHESGGVMCVVWLYLNTAPCQMPCAESSAVQCGTSTCIKQQVSNCSRHDFIQCCFVAAGVSLLSITDGSIKLLQSFPDATAASPAIRSQGQVVFAVASPQEHGR